MALSKSRRTPNLQGGIGQEYESYPVLAGVKIYNGAIVVLDVATGYARQCIPGAPGIYIGLGVAEGQDFGAVPGVAVDNTNGGNGAVYVKVKRGIFAFSNSTSHPIDNTMIGAGAFGEDDQTVSATNASSTLSQIGIIWRVDSGTGVGQNHGAVVWVGIGVGFGVGTVGAPGAIGHSSNTGAVLTFAVGDCALTAAQCVDGALFKVPTDAANSTITLPTASMPTTPVNIRFVADGTANTHTTTYREAPTTTLSAASTASKRHLAMCSWNGAVWAVSLQSQP